MDKKDEKGLIKTEEVLEGIIESSPSSITAIIRREHHMTPEMATALVKCEEHRAQAIIQKAKEETSQEIQKTGQSKEITNQSKEMSKQSFHRVATTVLLGMAATVTSIYGIAHNMDGLAIVGMIGAFLSVPIARNAAEGITKALKQVNEHDQHTP